MGPQCVTVRVIVVIPRSHLAAGFRRAGLHNFRHGAEHRHIGLLIPVGQRPSVHLPAVRDRPWKKGTLNARRIAPGADTRAVGSPGLPAACRFLDSWALDRPHAHELIFEAQRRDFSRPSAEEMLRDVGLTPRDVAGLIERVDKERRE
jgi:hypothetical protein